MSGRDRSVEARGLIARLSREAAELRARLVLAPLLPGGKIRTRVSGLIYELRPTRPFVGWGHFRPLNDREAEPVGAALPWERAAYLELFPALRVVLLWPDPRPARSGTWWAVPYNESDARQRFGPRVGSSTTEPRPVFLGDPENGAEPFERVLARVDGDTLWYDGPDPLADPRQAEWLRDAARQTEWPDHLLPGLASAQRLALLYARLRAIEITSAAERWREFQPERRTDRERRAWLRRLTESERLEARLRAALAKADAVLHGYREAPGPDGATSSVIVEWSEQGRTRRYRSAVALDTSVISSGICLSDQDGKFDLTSLVSVMRDAPDWAAEDG